MLVREILQEKQPFFECSVLLTCPSTSGQKPVCDGKKKHQEKQNANLNALFLRHLLTLLNRNICTLFLRLVSGA